MCCHIFSGYFTGFSLELSPISIIVSHYLQDPAERNMSESELNGVTLRGYLATHMGPGAYPSLVIIHEWWSLNRDTATRADDLAEERDVVLVANGELSLQYF